MSDQILEKLENLLNEEKWTRATINNYTVKNFDELNKLMNDFKQVDVIAKTRELTTEYLKHNKNSIVALYISSILQLEDGNIDDNSIYGIIKIFSDNMKWNIVEYLCKKFLSYAEDKIILRSLMESYKNLNKKDDLPELWERLIKVDFEEADLVVKLALLKEQNNEIEEAHNYYKKAINRYILNKNYVQVEELWRKLINYEEVGYEYFFGLDKKISKNFSNERSCDLLKFLYDDYKKKEEYDICIKILKLILEKNSTDDFSRKEIIEVYKLKYKDHSFLSDYIKISNLEGQWRNIHDAIISFEKHIAFDTGNFVHHRTWGIGRIREVSKDVFSIDFQAKKDHKMKLEMALNSLKVLQKNHIWVLKLKNPDKLKTMVKKDIPWALKILIQSYDNHATMKNFKEELVTDVLKESEWNTWWSNARKVLKTDSKFGTFDNDNDVFEVRDKPLTYDEKIYNSFKAAKDFNQRFNLMLEYYDIADLDSEYIEDMTLYFVTFLNSLNNVDEETFCSYLLVQNVFKKFKNLTQKIILQYTFKDFLDQIDEPIVIFENMSIKDYKRDFLHNLKLNSTEWEKVFLRIFYLYPEEYIYTDLVTNDKLNEEKIIKELVSGYKEYREAFLWLVVKVLNQNNGIVEEYKIDYDGIVLLLIHLVEIIGKDISLKKEVTKNKRIANQVRDFLFKTNYLSEYIKKSNEEFCKRLYTIANELLSVEQESVVMIKNTISAKYPDIDIEDKGLKYYEGMDKGAIIDKLLITAESLKTMQIELKNIKDVEIPENSKEIGYAMEKGDLKENAEYKSAKERQSYLQNKLNKLMTDIGRAQVVKREEITGDFVTFGTKVTLQDMIANAKVEFTILGPWESNSEKNIISYQSPLGANLLDKRVADETEFTLNDKKYHYIVKKIDVSKF